MVSKPTTKTITNIANSNDKVGGKCSFFAGQIKHFAANWKKLTSDKTILNIVEGYKLEFDTIPEQLASPNKIFTNNRKSWLMRLGSSLVKEFYKKVNHTEGEFLSNAFLRPKRMALIDLS